MRTTTVKKPWGSFIQFTHNEKDTVKILVIKPKEMLSLQSHRKRSEFWYILEGHPTITLNTKVKKYKPGDKVKFGPKTKHRIANNTKKLVRVLEIATGNFDEKDIVRYEDKYQR
tara:strand:- start:8256 stop:8597 length:342 start_codon:yes stop_codon:yes gene_type:complete